jgi:hypothetical protein
MKRRYCAGLLLVGETACPRKREQHSVEMLPSNSPLKRAEPTQECSRRFGVKRRLV